MPTTIDRYVTLIRLVVQNFLIDNGPEWAAAIAFYTLFSLFPLLIAVISIAGFFVDPDWVLSRLPMVLGEILPEGEQRVERIVRDALARQSGVSVASILVFFWSGSRVFRVITKALNVAFDVDETYGFVRRTGIALTMALSIGLLFAVAIVSSWLLRTFPDLTEGIPVPSYVLVDVVPVVLLFIAFFLIYLLVPRRRPHWPMALAGAVVATSLILLARPVFLFIVNRFADYNVVYGSLAVAVIGIFWAWIGALILLFSGELVAHAHAMIVDGLTPREILRRHQQRSPVERA